MGELPTGIVTFLFTDIEGSTRLLQRLGEGYRSLQDDHFALMRKAIASGDGVEIRTQGDSFFVVFRSPSKAVRAVVSVQRALAAHLWGHGEPLRVRMGLHTGEGILGGDDYLGIDVNRAARIAAAAHGGQVLLSEATRTLVQGDLPDGVELVFVGEHRLKDLERPELLNQIAIAGLQTEFPPIRSLEPPTNLPGELTSFIGRDRELHAIEALFDRARLITLTGPGGSGKTRLGLRVAASMLDRFPDGVHFVELAPVTDPALVPSLIASSIGIREEGPRPMEQTLQAELRGRAAMLVLDNFEQVIEAAPVITSLLEAAPRLRVLVTSRGPLKLQGEQEFPVPPLDLPDPTRLPAPEDLAAYEAVALFVDRAMAVDPGFRVTEHNARAIVEICTRLDGLPLAIELAASRLRLLSPELMLERLDRSLPLLAGGSRDLPARQRTLRNTIAWSHDLLSDAVASLFRRLGVFAGGFTVEAARSVCDPQEDLGVDTLEGLEALLDNALIRRRDGNRGEVRFDMLQTIREFGLERLGEDVVAKSIARRHAEYFLAVAEKAEPELRAGDSERYLDLLELEHDNLGAALAWAIAHEEGAVGLRLIAALWRFWHLHGHLTAGRRWADIIVGMPSAAGRTATRARGLWAAAGLAYWQTDPPAVRTATEEALAIARELGDPEILAEATYHAAFWYPFEGDLSTTSAVLREAQERFEQVGNRRGIADCLFAMSVMDRLSGDLPSARAKAEEGLRIHRELGDMFGTTGSLFALGRTAEEMGDLATARSLILESLELSNRMGDRTSIAIALDLLAGHENARGAHLAAMRLAGASAALKDAVGGEAPPAMIRLPDPREVAGRYLGTDELRAAWEEGGAMSLDQVIRYARQDGG